MLALPFCSASVRDVELTEECNMEDVCETVDVVAPSEETPSAAADVLEEIDVTSQLESLQKLLKSVECSLEQKEPLEPIINLNSELTEVISLRDDESKSGSDYNSLFGFSCTLCSAHFESQGQLSRHIRLGTCLQAKNFFCDKCPSRFSSQKNLNRHQKRSQCGKRYLELCNKAEENSSKVAKVEGKEEDSPSKVLDTVSTPSTPATPTTTEKPYRCDNCHYSFSTKAAISQHIKSMRCEDNKLKGLANDSKTAPVYQCHMCNASLASKSGLSKHLKRGQCRVYKCTLCNSSFRFVHELKSHFKVQHNGSKTSMEEVIHANQIVSQALKWIGIPSMTGSQTLNSGICYECKICDYSATSQRSVDNHMRIHMRQISALGADTNCFVCDFKSDEKDALIKHYITSHPNFAVIDKTSQQASLLNIFSKLLDLAKVTTADRCVLNGNIKLGLDRIFSSRDGKTEVKLELAEDDKAEDEEEEEEDGKEGNENVNNSNSIVEIKSEVDSS